MKLEKGKQQHFARIDFRGGEIASIFDGRVIWVSISQVCRSIGLDWSSQKKKITNDVVLSREIRSLNFPFGSDEHHQLAMPLEMMQGWLFTIDLMRIHDSDVREKATFLRKNAFRLIHDYWTAYAGRSPVFGKAENNEGAKSNEITIDEIRNFLGGGQDYEKIAQVRNLISNLQLKKNSEDFIKNHLGEDIQRKSDCVDRFFQLIFRLGELGEIINLHRNPRLLAIHLKDVEILAVKHNLDFDQGPQLWSALRYHEAFETVRVVNCRDRKTRYCWVFRTDNLPFIMPTV